jgi:lipopolysaccharide/colanic/teichoic acid biosynthesis glycosyltransferase
MARVDLIYAQSWSIWRDFELLLRTVATVVRYGTKK